MSGVTAAERTELSGWIRLAQTEGVGTAIARKLLGVLGLPEQIFAATYSALIKVVPERIAVSLMSDATPEQEAYIARALDWAAMPGNRIVTLADADYPASLLTTDDPPLMLYVKGRLDLLRAPSLAIVGSRNATTDGIMNAMRFAESISQSGLTVVSGLALGIDTAAHQGALPGVGSTVAVIGTGADIVYPAKNRDLAHQIAQGGCIVSEYALGTSAMSGNFPRRNRIISGLSRGVLVVEAAIASGTLITARLAIEQGRDVFAIPGSIHSPMSKGCHRLIKQGAKLVESAGDILEELRLVQ
jgi:DNA processing protein